MLRANRKDRVIASLVVGALAVVGLVLWTNRPSLEKTARRALDCAATGDSRCLFDLTTSDERTVYSLTPARLDALVRDYVMPVGKPVRRKGLTLDYAPQGSEVTASERWTTIQGKEQGFGVHVAVTDEGIKCPYMVTNLLLAASVYKDNRPSTGIKAADKLRAWLQQAVDDGPALSRMGYPGIYRNEEEGLVPWPQWAESCGARLNRTTKQADSR